ncbi:FMN-binding glutamate synthase family protein [Alicyclobacillus herbarius]|uniref:FMN-binding glutamate synthase family protein n=1 Tax=Alicyclobacillus herbarius TaxID=122960 RepID=UPI0023525CC8|nr:FMN-binding glutamate synthase family protein [Alicyclobacillus herbarius]
MSSIRWSFQDWLTMLSVLLSAELLLAVVACVTAPFWSRFVLKKITEYVTKRLFTEEYTKNLLEGLTALRKFGVQWTFENELRAHTAQPLEKPIGTARLFPHFDGLLFTPVQLTRRPLDHRVPVNLETVIGRKAQRPMMLSMPVMVSAMGYGVALSKPFVRAIARGTAMAGTACNAGQGPALEEFRKLARHLVVQYHGASWRPSSDILRQADMIEIRFGQGANAGCGTLVPASGLPAEVQHDLGLKPGQTGYIPAGHPEVIRASRDLRRLVHRLRRTANGVPIAVKLAASHVLEQDLYLAVQAGVDVIVLDGAQGGTHSSPAILVDDFGLPTLSALCRAVRFLREQGYWNRVDLVVSGGIRTPGDMLKALALGANAVYIGTAALFATAHTQLTQAVPFEPPTQIAWANAEIPAHFQEQDGARSLANFLDSCAKEMRMGIRALGKTSVHDVDETDLVAWDPDVARITGLPLV